MHQVVVWFNTSISAPDMVAVLTGLDSSYILGVEDGVIVLKKVI